MQNNMRLNLDRLMIKYYDWEANLGLSYKTVIY